MLQLRLKPSPFQHSFSPIYVDDHRILYAGHACSDNSNTDSHRASGHATDNRTVHVDGGRRVSAACGRSRGGATGCIRSFRYHFAHTWFSLPAPCGMFYLLLVFLHLCVDLLPLPAVLDRLLVASVQACLVVSCPEQYSLRGASALLSTAQGVRQDINGSIGVSQAQKMPDSSEEGVDCDRNRVAVPGFCALYITDSMPQF